MPHIEFVCLANSRKHGGRCVAGIRTDGGGWVRMVSPDAGGTLTCFDYKLGESDEPRPFDVLRVGVRERRIQPHQPENWVIDETPWQLVRRPADKVGQDLVRSHIVHWPDLLGSRTTTMAYDDFLRRPNPSSLAIVRPSRPVLVAESRGQGRKRLRVRFSLRGATYELMCTDPQWEEATASWKPGEYPWWRLAPYAATPLVVISLTEPFGEPPQCYKIVATVWPAPDIVCRRDEQQTQAATSATRHAPLPPDSRHASPGVPAAGVRSGPR
jgi:hypothetical protein